jgi:S1-C subfamily serine protease
LPEAAVAATSTVSLPLALLAWIAVIAMPVAIAAADPALTAGAADTTVQVPVPDAEKLFRAVVTVRTQAVPGARSAVTLGREREGTGILIGKDGLIVTIGYLIVEADQVSIVDYRGRSLPAQVIGYDHATGFGLLKAIVPIYADPIALGSSTALTERDPVLIASHTGVDDVAFAWIVSKRAFSGNWEYMLDEALWTSPPMLNWSGAGLIDRDGKLVGIGSLIVRDASGDDAKVPGNLFVPIDTLKTILPDLVAEGHRKGPPRPWLGVAADEVQGRLIVSRVSAGGPAEEAGVQVGDIILAVNGEAVRTQSDFYRKVWTGRSAGSAVPLKLLQGADVRELSVNSIDRVQYFRPRTTY